MAINVKFLYLFFLCIVFSTSGFVIVEPAPFDVGMLIIFTIVLLSNKFSFEHSNKYMYLTLFVLILSNAVSLLFAENKLRGIVYFSTTIYLIITCIFLIYIINRYKKNAIDSIFLGYTFAAIASSLLGLLAYFNLIPMSDLYIKYGRATGLFKDPNVFGPFMIPIVLYSLHKLEGEMVLKKRFFWINTFLITSVAVFLSYSRAAWGSYILSIFIYVFLKFLINPNKEVIFKSLASFFILSLIMVYVANIPVVKQDFEKRFSYQQYDNVRFSHQEEALNIALTHPLGKGPGQSELVLNYATHNSFLRVWLENGYFGLISYLMILVLSIITGIKKFFKYKHSLLAVSIASICAILMNSFVVDVVHWRHFWIMLAIPWLNYKTKSEYNFLKDTTKIDV